MSSNASKVELRLRALSLSVNLSYEPGDRTNFLLSHFHCANRTNLFSASC
jgi:hypothetical protein